MTGSKKSVLQKIRRRRVGVLFGGWSAERTISLKSGAAVCSALRQLHVRFVPIDVTRHVAEQIRRAKIDVAFLALHGPFGEDGSVQGLLEIMGIPYTGSGVRASAVAMHKPSAKKLFESTGIPTPPWFTISKQGQRWSTDPAEAGKWLQRTASRHAWVVKPVSQGSAVGVAVIRNAAEWRQALWKAFAFGDEVLAERFIQGTEVTVGVVGNRTLPVIEIIPKHDFYDFYSKYAKGGSQHLIPARLPAATAVRVSDLALKAFRVLGCRHLARVDLIVTRSQEPFVLEVNTLPGLTNTSLLPDAARAAGLSFEDLILEVLSLAVAGQK